MIYRIVAEADAGSINPGTGKVRRVAALAGAWTAMPVATGDSGTPYPRRAVGTRTRFYYTERGWELHGQFIAAEARRLGVPMRVIRRKNPHPSQVVYRDDVQVAILPRRAGGRRGEYGQASEDA